MKATTTSVLIAVLLLGTAHLTASGPLGIYGIVEKVVFEPNEKSPERIQVWGAFAYVDGSDRALGVSTVKRGYLYFKLPAPGSPTHAQTAVVKTEWADLKAVAGTGQAIGFGTWSYVGGFERLTPEAKGSMPPYILERGGRGGTPTDLRVRPQSEAPTSPATYQTNAGIVKLTDRGSHAAVVKQLKTALEAPTGSAFRLDIGRAIAGNAPNVKSAVLVVRPLACSDPAAVRITGTAEGIVDGVRRSIPLKLIPIENRGVHAVSEQWPAGRWVLSLAGTCAGATAGVLVPLGKTGFVRESAKFLPRAATAPEIDASLTALTAGGSR